MKHKLTEGKLMVQWWEKSLLMTKSVKNNIEIRKQQFDLKGPH